MSKVTTRIRRKGFVKGLFWRKLEFPRDRVDGDAEAPRPASRGYIIIERAGMGGKKENR